MPSATDPNNYAASMASDQKSCNTCNAIIRLKAEICPHCGVRQRKHVSKTTLLLLTLFLGWFGVHKFYLYKRWQGLIYLLLFWTGIPAIISLFEFIFYMFTSSDRLNEKYSASNESIVTDIWLYIGIVIFSSIAIPAYQEYLAKARSSANTFSESSQKIAKKLPPLETSASQLGPVVDGAWTDEGKDWVGWAATLLAKTLGKPVTIESVRTKSIPFYSTDIMNVLLVEAIEKKNASSYFILTVAGQSIPPVILNGTGKSISDMNKSLQFSILSSEQAKSYLKFYVSAINGDRNEGMFHIVDPDDPNDNQLLPSINKGTEVNTMDIRPEKNVGWHVSADVIYNKTLSAADFLVHSNGEVEMLNDSLKQKQLNISDRVVVKGNRWFYVDLDGKEKNP